MEIFPCSFFRYHFFAPVNIATNLDCSIIVFRMVFIGPIVSIPILLLVTYVLTLRVFARKVDIIVAMVALFVALPASHK